jgi:REP element-mobilizing transposase RayT
VTRARNQQISLDDTPYYHCISRCVRRAYLCGDDPATGRNFDHRKQWLVTRIKQLSAQFAVDVCAYAAMSNHYHLVLHVDQPAAQSWSNEEVIRRWTGLFPRNATFVETLIKNKSSKAAQKLLQLRVELWRQRLVDISWFMRCVNETVARDANREDQCSGRFWEGRFKSQALLDEKALVTCMAYVDLNPIRAGMAGTLDTSDFTSIQERLIEQAKKIKKRSYGQHQLLTNEATKHLMGHQPGAKQAKLIGLTDIKKSFDNAIPISTKSYLGLLDITAQALLLEYSNQTKAKRLLDDHVQTLAKFGVSSDTWLTSVRDFHKHYATAVGSAESLLHYHQSRIKVGVDFKHPHKWIRGINSSKLFYGT